MKIKVKSDLALRDQDTGERTILKKGLHEVAEKWGQWLCQVYALSVEMVVGAVKAVTTPDPEPVKAEEQAEPEEPKAKPKAKKKVAKKGKK